MDSDEAKFQLLPRRWYAMDYWHSNGGLLFTHHSPIYLFAVIPRKTGRRVLDIEFFHAAYSEGVQYKGYSLRILKRAFTYLLAERTADRQIEAPTVMISDLEWKWLDTHFPGFLPEMADNRDVQVMLERIFNLPRQ